MKIIKINLNTKEHIPAKIKIIPLSDIHLGSDLCELKYVKSVLERIKNEKDTYTILNGDIINNDIKSSVGDVYNEQLTPMQQIIEAVNLLEPIKDKILVLAEGNHEARSYKDSGIQIMQIVARELGIEERYAPNMWYLFLHFGNNVKNKTTQYQITGYHGNVGGRKSGSKINRLEEMSEITIADLYIMSHTHKPIITKSVIYIPDNQNKAVIKKELNYLMTNSFQSYGGYAEKLGLKPLYTGITEVELDGYKKLVKLSI